MSRAVKCQRCQIFTEKTTFTFISIYLHLADTFIQSDLQCYTFFFVSMCVPWESNPQPLRCLRNALTTEPQEHKDKHKKNTKTPKCFVLKHQNKN